MKRAILAVLFVSLCCCSFAGGLSSTTFKIMCPEEEQSFFSALENAETENIRFFLDHGASPDYRFSAGEIPVIAEHVFSVEVLAILLEYGVNLNAYSNNPTSQTGILARVFSNLQRPETGEILDFLIANGAVPSEHDLLKLIGPQGWAPPFSVQDDMTCQQEMRLYLKNFRRAAEAYKIAIPAAFVDFEKKFNAELNQLHNRDAR